MPGLFAFIETRSAPVAPSTPLSHAASVDIARVEVFSSLAAARDDWIELEATACCSPYQTFAFAEAWFSTLGSAAGAQPYVIVAREASGRPAALLPLARRSLGVFSIAAFLGGKHSNYNLGLFRASYAWSEAALRSLLISAARAAPTRVDCFVLQNQPRMWQGVRNPLAVLGGRRSPSFATRSKLPPTFQAWLDTHASKSLQGGLRRKRARLESIAPVRHVLATDEGQAERMIAAFIAQKRQRAHEHGPANPYESESAQAFLRRLATSGLAEGRPTMELHALMLGDRIIAAFGGLAGKTRLSCLLLGHDRDRAIARFSPGRLLLNEVVRSAIERRFETFDLGVGEARYKSAVCKRTELLFDSFVATNSWGRVAALVYSVRQDIKGRIKRSPLLMAAASRLRKSSP